MQQLQQARSLDDENGLVTRQTSYHLGRGLQLQGQSDEAVKQFARTRQLYGDTLEGLAAALAEADLLRQNGDFEGAMLGYRRVLETFADTTEYRSVVLPLPQLRERLMLALRDFVGRKRFADALVLLEYFPPLFTRAEQLELRGDTLERWGNDLIEHASGRRSRSRRAILPPAGGTCAAPAWRLSNLPKRDSTPASIATTCGAARIITSAAAVFPALCGCSTSI